MPRDNHQTEFLEVKSAVWCSMVCCVSSALFFAMIHGIGWWSTTKPILGWEVFYVVHPLPWWVQNWPQFITDVKLVADWSAIHGAVSITLKKTNGEIEKKFRKPHLNLLKEGWQCIAQNQTWINRQIHLPKDFT